MVASTFANKSFELGGATDHPALPLGWTASFTTGATEIASFDNKAAGWEDFEDGYFGVLPNVLISRVQYFKLVDGSTIQVSVNGGAPQVVTFNSIDFVSITLATAIEVAAVITAALVGASASATTAGAVRIDGASATDTLEIVGPAYDANDVLGFPYVRNEPRLLVSNAEPFALVDGMTLTFGVKGSPERVAFYAASFADIGSASASEVKAVLDATIGANVTTMIVLGRLIVQASPFGTPIEVIGGAGVSTANEVLGFPSPAHAFVGADLDIETYPWGGGLLAEAFEQSWAGLAATIFTNNKAPYVISNGDTLDVIVDGAPVQNVVFAGISVAGAATAAEVASNLTTQLTTPVAVAVAIEATEVSLTSSVIGPGSQVRVTGGTAQAALDFTPSGGSTVQGNEAFYTVLPSSTAAVFDEAGTNESCEDFEELWGAPDIANFLWVFTDEVFAIFSVTSGDVFTLVLGTETHVYTATALDTPTSVATNIAAKVNLDSDLMTAAPSGFAVVLTRIDTRYKVDPFSFSVVGGGSVVYGTGNSSALIAAATFDSGAPEDVEDFEEEWQNDSWLWIFTVDTFEVLVATVGAVYTLHYGPDVDRQSVSYTAIGGDDPVSIATALAAALTLDTNVSVGAVGPPGVFTVEGVGTYQINLKDTNDGGLTRWTSSPINPAVLTVAKFDPGLVDFEDFETVINAQATASFPSVGVDPIAGGAYQFNLNDELIQYVSPGGETRVQVLTGLLNAIALSPLKNYAEGEVVGNMMLLRSQACPRVELTVSLISSPGSILAVTAEDTSAAWTNLAIMCSI